VFKVCPRDVEANATDVVIEKNRQKKGKVYRLTFAKKTVVIAVGYPWRLY
jgi:hypothetical protein